MNYAEISKLTMTNKYIYKTYESLKKSGIEKSLRA
jgi:hypothetical protein